MSRTGSRFAGYLTISIFSAAAVLLFGGQLLTQAAYAVERGKIKASTDELAELEPQIAALQSVSRAFSLVAKSARPGVVHLRVEGGQIEIGDEGEMPRGLRIPGGVGSGIIFDKNGYILTNNHVVEDRESIRVVLNDEREYDASVVGTDPKTDLAVLKIDAPDLTPLRFGDSDALEVGDWVIAVGSPFGLQQTVTHGIVSAKGRDQVPGVDIWHKDFIQTDAAINPGNSGGPLLNLRGEVVGVNTAIATRGDGVNAGVAFTIPSRLAMRIADELRTSGVVRRGWIGIQYVNVSARVADTLGLLQPKGVIILGVQRRSPADRAGLLPEDVIVEFNGTGIDGRNRLQGLVSEMKPDERVRVRVIRDGEERAIDLRLTLQPENLSDALDDDPILARAVPRLGIDARAFGSDARRDGPDGFGVKVVNVRTLGETPNGLEPDDVITSVNGQAVRNLRELNERLTAIPMDRTVRLEVRSEDEAKKVIEISPRGDR